MFANGYRIVGTYPRLEALVGDLELVSLLLDLFESGAK